MALSNPAFSKDTFAGFEQVYGSTRPATMTVQGTVSKTFLLLAILSATMIWSWNQMASGHLALEFLIGAGVGAFVLSLITIFRPSAAPWTAPVYAAFEGIVLGMASYVIERFSGYPGIALQAVSLTCATLFLMLFLYTTRIIKVTQKLRAGISAAVGAVFLVYLVAFIVQMCGGHVPFLNDASPVGIVISLVIVGIAAFRLLLNFDSIEQGAQYAAPRFMEWYGAFGLILTLVWLYLEILDLLQKLQSRD